MSGPSRPSSATAFPRPPSRGQRLAAVVLASSLRLLAATLRLRIHDPHLALDRLSQGPVIFALWHNRLALSPFVYRCLTRHLASPRSLAALVSASRDGAFLTATLAAFGIRAVRGSSSRRGAQALLELASQARAGLDLAITPDGPRGPCYHAQPGVVGIASALERPIVPVSINCRWKLRLKSWDRFQIPLPFAGCTIVLGEPLSIPPAPPKSPSAPIPTSIANPPTPPNDFITIHLTELQRRLLAITVD